MKDGTADSSAGVRKPPREKTARKGREAVRRALWGFGRRGIVEEMNTTVVIYAVGQVLFLEDAIAF